MSQLANIADAAGIAERDPKKKAVLELIYQQKKAIEIALPKSFDAERFTRIVLTEVRRNPTLLRCNPMSLLGAMMLSAQLGLELGPLGHAYLVPFGQEVTFIIGYRGMIALARRSDQLSTIQAYAVHEGDEFSYNLGLNPDIKHVPADGDNRALTHVYAIAKYKDGGSNFVVLTKGQVDSYMARSPSRNAKTSPWKSDYEAMALKTAIRRLFPWLPVAVEFAQAVSVADEAPVKGLSADILADLADNVPDVAIEAEDAEVIEPEAVPTEPVEAGQQELVKT